MEVISLRNDWDNLPLLNFITAAVSAINIAVKVLLSAIILITIFLTLYFLCIPPFESERNNLGLYQSPARTLALKRFTSERWK